MLAVALAVAMATTPGWRTESWTLDAYCYAAVRIDRIAYEDERRSALNRGGEAGLNAFIAAHPPSFASRSLPEWRQELLAKAIADGASQTIVDRQIGLFNARLSVMRKRDQAGFYRVTQSCRPEVD